MRPPRFLMWVLATVIAVAVTGTGATVRTVATPAAYQVDAAALTPIPGEAAGCNYRWAGMFTTLTPGDGTGQHGECGTPLPARYYGWTGVSGQITTPATNPALDPVIDHQAGWLGMDFADGSSIQVGWFRGTIGCGTASINWTGDGYHLYVEARRPLNDPDNRCADYHVRDVAPLGLGGARTYRVERSGSCWNVYYDDVLARNFCGSDWPATGAAEVENELADNSGTAVMPSSVFGAPSPDTRQALRLRGATGYVPWTASIARSTTILDWGALPGEDQTHFIALADYYNLRLTG